jgi:hypothetical protein
MKCMGLVMFMCVAHIVVVVVVVAVAIAVRNNAVF